MMASAPVSNADVFPDNTKAFTESIEFDCQGGTSLKAKEEHARRKTRCPACGTELEIPGLPEETPLIPVELGVSILSEGLEEKHPTSDREVSLADVCNVLKSILDQLSASPRDTGTTHGRQREYKVLTQKDKWFSGKFDPEKS